MRRTGLGTICCLGAVVLCASVAGSQERGRSADYAEIREVASAFVSALTSAGLDNFKGLAFPCYLVMPGMLDEVTEFRSETDLAPPGDRVKFEKRDMAVRLAGKAAVCTVQFRPTGSPQWATAVLLLTRPAGFWVVRAIAASPNQLAADSDLDMVGALQSDFVRCITTNGPAVFDGLDFPLIFVNGRTGTVRLYDAPEDLPPAGHSLALRARRLRWAYADNIAACTMELTRADEVAVEGVEAETAALVCAKWDEGWRAVAILTGPSTSSDQEAGEGEATDGAEARQ